MGVTPKFMRQSEGDSKVLRGISANHQKFNYDFTLKYHARKNCFRLKCKLWKRKRKLAKREVRQIFDTLEVQSTGYNMKVTFLELYNEEITDLLASDDNSRSAAVEDRQKKLISLMEDRKGCVVVRGLEEESWKEFKNKLVRTSSIGTVIWLDVEDLEGKNEAYKVFAEKDW
ncbi:putative 125 kDa kinesin-related protein [Morus notabilis]|uniref:Putative 125 kDa kinesin-related protein n=1 Tax=Morus notabilis TaxID=981085 RepID=W9R166_9ROSA|nr:putative 125 kDa kinesin-related protein [Morus notabilis]